MKALYRLTPMSEYPHEARPAETYFEVEDALLSRWPEHRLDPTLDRIREFAELLGDPQRNYDVVHLTGTNGKTSTARMIESLLISLGLRTGRFTSPHLESMTERIVVDGEALDEATFVAAFNDVAPFTHLVDANNSHPLSFFETIVGMAYAAFSDAPVDAAVVEVGMGGAWDATNIADGKVAVFTPIAVDHAAYLGGDPVTIAREKVGIIKEGAVVISAQQPVDVLEVIAEKCREMNATLHVEGIDFGVETRVAAVGGQVLTLGTPNGRYEDLFLPLYGAHQAQNAAVALTAVEAFMGGQVLTAEVVTDAFAEMTSPGRLEVVRRSPTILLDAAHNPHGAEAAVAALEDSFSFSPLVGVVGVMGDKDVEGLLAAFEPVFAHIVCTQNSTPRAMPAAELARTAVGIFGVDRVVTAPNLLDAIDQATALAEAGGVFGEGLGSGGVLITGSVVTVGEARRLINPKGA
jgi:dihydrofolate synthase/folylpolyglutamate synthase